MKANQYLEERKLAEQGEQKEVLIVMPNEADEPKLKPIEQEKPEVLATWARLYLMASTTTASP